MNDTVQFILLRFLKYNGNIEQFIDLMGAEREVWGAFELSFKGNRIIKGPIYEKHIAFLERHRVKDE